MLKKVKVREINAGGYSGSSDERLYDAAVNLANISYILPLEEGFVEIHLDDGITLTCQGTLDDFLPEVNADVSTRIPTE